MTNVKEGDMSTSKNNLNVRSDEAAKPGVRLTGAPLSVVGLRAKRVLGAAYRAERTAT